MKKVLKRVLSVILILSLLICLSGCEVLEKAKESKAVYKDKNILYNGYEYIKLSYCKYFSPDINRERMLFLTEKDVPVLLAGFFGKEIYLINDIFIHDDVDDTMYYCRSDHYEEIENLCKSENAFNNICYEYGYYDEKTGNYTYKTYNLTKEEKQLVEKTYKNADVLKLPKGAELSDILDSVELEKSSDNGYFKKYYAEIILTEENYYFVRYDEKQKKEIYYTIPKKLTSKFDKILEKYYEQD